MQRKSAFYFGFSRQIGIAGFLGGTAIAFFVVLGDLGPPLIANMAGIESSANLRLVILTGMNFIHWYFKALGICLKNNLVLVTLENIFTNSKNFRLGFVCRPTSFLHEKHRKSLRHLHHEHRLLPASRC